jgi:hypothetical protein
MPGARRTKASPASDRRATFLIGTILDFIASIPSG